MLTLSKLCMIAAGLAIGVGSRGPVKFTNVTQSKVRKDYWSVSATYPKFQDSTDVTHLANQAMAEFSATSVRQWAAGTPKDMEKPGTPWLEELTPTVVTAQADLISLQVTLYADTGGAHPSTSQLMFNFGLVAGKPKKLTLGNLFRFRTPALAIVSKIVMAKLRERNASWVLDGQVIRLDKKQADEFVIKPDRLTFIFSPYEMGSYAEGTYEVDVPFISLGNKLDPNGPLKDLLANG